jgi:hypothetical protein
VYTVWEVPYTPSFAEHLVLSWKRVGGRETQMWVNSTASDNARSVEWSYGVGKDQRIGVFRKSTCKDLWRYVKNIYASRRCALASLIEFSQLTETEEGESCCQMKRT